MTGAMHRSDAVINRSAHDHESQQRMADKMSGEAGTSGDNRLTNPMENRQLYMRTGTCKHGGARIIMIHIKKIMVPVDFSETSAKAVKYAVSLALEFDATLMLAHIVPSAAEARSEAKLDLSDLIPYQYRECLNFDIMVRAGWIRPEILGLVDEKHVDLVVMGTRDRPYFERVLLGSLTERMLRKVSVPVLTVSDLDPQKEIRKAGRIPLRHILYATDLTHDCETGLEFALRFACAFDARLIVAHVIRTNARLPVDLCAREQERVNRFVRLKSNGRIPITTAIGSGVPSEEINKLSRELGADLIVINLRDKKTCDRILLGSTADRVIRQATVPVLSLPMPATYASRWAAA
jgi:nucleotide-binding universal stress UspA family protein